MKVRLKNNEKSAADATNECIKGLGFGSHLLRDENNEVKFDADGLATVVTGNAGYIAFALRSQGYVKEVIENS